MILKNLEDAHSHKNIISITLKYSKRDDSLIGTITEINNGQIIMDEIDEYGKHIGNIMINIDEIRYVLLYSWYIDGLTFICKNNLILNSDAKVIVRREIPEWKNYLQQIKNKDKIIEIIFENSKSTIGKILKFNSNFLLIRTIGEDGLEDGTTCYRLDDIKELNYDGLIEQKIKLLFDSK